ncbi:MAG TPA: FHA domain-containing protein [Clostridiaceae bacterium]|nr:FHA domain-containing protein [Clostridiaceae bacterium]
MPQIAIQETRWGSKLIIHLLRDEHLDCSALQIMQQRTTDLLLCPLVVEQSNQIDFIYQLTGLTPLSQIQHQPGIELSDQLAMLAGLCRRLQALSHFLSPHHILIDPEFIFFHRVKEGVAKDMLLTPIILGLPLQNTDNREVDTSFTGCLALIVEPIIKRAQDEKILPAAQIDRLLISSWETLESLVNALETIQKTTRSASPSNDQAKSLPLQTQESTCNKNICKENTVHNVNHQSLPAASIDAMTDSKKTSKGNRLKQFFFVQLSTVAVILWLAANHYLTQGIWKLVVTSILAIYLLLDIVILFHPESKQNRHETTFQKKQCEDSLKEQKIEKEFRKQLREIKKGTAPHQSIQPLARLEPVELAYPGSDTERLLSDRAFVSATLSQPIFCIGKDPLAADLCLKGGEIRPLHAEINYRHNHYELSSSYRFTKFEKPEFSSELWLNGKLLNSSESWPLNNGDEIRIGRYIYSFELQSLR